MIKKISFLLLLIVCNLIYGQIINERLFYTLQPQHILDNNNDDISFAYGMRILESDYNGPLIRLRKNSDTNLEAQDFYHADNDIIDINAVNTYANGETLYVVTWYDQSGNAIDATQTDTDKQPTFIASASLPYLVGDGANDVLVVGLGLQTLTENGKNGSVFGVFFATDRKDTVFGTSTGTNRWLSHINWDNERTYFDPGSCCQNPGRWFTNDVAPGGSLNEWDQYTFVRRDDPLDATTDRRILKLGGDLKRDLDYDDALQCTLDFNFGICAVITSATNTSVSNSSTRINEMIMYAQGKDDEVIETIEENQLTFWGL